MEKIRVRKEDSNDYLLRRSYEEKLAVSAQDLLDIASWVEENREQLEKEALEALQEELQRKARLTGKNDPVSKMAGGFDLVRHNPTLYLHYPWTGMKDDADYEESRILERW